MTTFYYIEVGYRNPILIIPNCQLSDRPRQKEIFTYNKISYTVVSVEVIVDIVDRVVQNSVMIKLKIKK